MKTPVEIRSNWQRLPGHDNVFQNENGTILSIVTKDRFPIGADKHVPVEDGTPCFKENPTGQCFCRGVPIPEAIQKLADFDRAIGNKATDEQSAHIVALRDSLITDWIDSVLG